MRTIAIGHRNNEGDHHIRDLQRRPVPLECDEVNHSENGQKVAQNTHKLCQPQPFEAGDFENVIVGPLAGVFVDRWNVKRTMIISDLVRAALILGLVFVTRLEQIYVLFFLVSTVSSFFGPSQSITPFLDNFRVADDTP
jgi:hypothetical protein